VQEIAPGIFHWTAFRATIGMRVSSYYVEPAGVVIDPMTPEDGFEVFDGHEPPQQALLTIRHHYRDCDAFRERFGLTVVCTEAGLHEFEGTDRQVEGFRFGDEVAPGVVAVGTDAISPLMDEPEKTKERLLNAYRGLLERDFDSLLFAHGEPLVGGGRAALKGFVT
jgi:hypothetical protein